MNSRRDTIKKVLTAVAGITISKNIAATTYSQADYISRYGLIDEGTRVINAGIGGNTSSDLLKRIEKDCLSQRPDLTLLMVGTNDMNSRKHIPLPQYEENLTKLVSEILASKSKLVLMTILPCYEPYLLTRHPAEFYQPEGVSGRRKQVNEVIKRIALKHQVLVLDMEHRFLAIGNIGLSPESLIKNEANSNKTDGIHPTNTGYRFMALSAYEFINAHKLPCKKIVCFGDSITAGDGSITNNSYPAYLQKLFSPNP